MYSIGPEALPINGFESGALSPPEPGSNPEPRIALCRRSQNIGFFMDACTTHLSSDEPTAKMQVGTLYTWSVGAASTWNITGGDFNQHWPPGSAQGLANYWGRGAEMQVDQTPVNPVSTTDNHGKLDYIFAFRTHASVVGPPTLVHTISDHHYCVAVFNFF